MRELNVELIIQGYKDGKSIREIGDEHNVNRETIRQRLIKAGIKRRSNKGGLIGKYNPKSRETLIKNRAFGGKFKDKSFEELKEYFNEVSIGKRYLIK